MNETVPEILKSKVDASVNFVWEVDKGEALEARYVRRHQDYLACYLSTQTACAQACRMCHLTATGQNHPKDASFEQVFEQTRAVLDYYLTQPKAKTVHYNFMARGEPLASQVILEESEDLFLYLGAMAKDCGLAPRFLVSTIMPESLNKSLVDLFPVIHPEIYYSLYSMWPGFRKRWLPRAMDPNRALDLLTEWQYHTKKVVKIHFALIEGQNDSPETAQAIGDAVMKRGLRVDYALVHYNPPSERYGKESSPDAVQLFSEELADATPGARIKIVTRVGPDVAASCGMFINP